MSRQHYITMVCMTCGLPYGLKPTLRGKDGTSHGYCAPCGKIKLAEVEAEIRAM